MRTILIDPLKANGFHFAIKGHACPGGKTAYWANACDKPIGFKRRGGMAKARHNHDNNTSNQPGQRPDPLADTSLDDLAAVFA